MQQKVVTVAKKFSSHLDTLANHFLLYTHSRDKVKSFYLDKIVAFVFPESKNYNVVAFIGKMHMWTTLEEIQRFSLTCRATVFILLDPQEDGVTFKCTMSSAVQIKQAVEDYAILFYLRGKTLAKPGCAISTVNENWLTSSADSVKRTLLGMIKRGVSLTKVESNMFSITSLREALSLLRRFDSNLLFYFNFSLFRKIDATSTRPPSESSSWDTSLASDQTGNDDSERASDASEESDSEESNKKTSAPPDSSLSSAGQKRKEAEDSLLTSHDSLSLHLQRYDGSNSGTGRSVLTSISCLEKMYSRSVENIPYDALLHAPLNWHKNLYLLDSNGKKVLGKQDLPVVEKGAYVFAKEDAFNRNVAMFSFDAGLTHENPKIAKKLAFSKKYVTGSYSALFNIFRLGHSNFLRYDRDAECYSDYGLHRCCYESLIFFRLSKFFMDCEMYQEFNPVPPEEDAAERVASMMEVLISFVEEMALKLCKVTLRRSDWLVLSSDKGTKISRHIICLNPAFAFRTMLAMDWFYLMCFDELAVRLASGNADVAKLRIRDKNGDFLWFWDGCTTKEFQLFRVYHGDKFGAGRPLIYKNELNYAPLGGLAQEWKSMEYKERFLNSLIQYPWKGEVDRENVNSAGVDFEIYPGAEIGRFRCVFENDILIGFESSTKRKVGKRTIKAKNVLSTTSFAVAPEKMSAIEEWLKTEACFERWRGYPLDTARYKFLPGNIDGYYTLMVEMKGDGTNDVHCNRRACLGSNQVKRMRNMMFNDICGDSLSNSNSQNVSQSARKYTHSGAPVLLIFSYNRFRKFWEVSQTCNKPECAEVGQMSVSGIPEEICELLRI